MEFILGILFAKKVTGRRFSFTKMNRSMKKQNKSFVVMFKSLVKMMSRFDRFMNKGIKTISKTNVAQAPVVVENIVAENVIDFESFKLKKVSSK